MPAKAGDAAPGAGWGIRPWTAPSQAPSGGDTGAGQERAGDGGCVGGEVKREEDLDESLERR